MLNVIKELNKNIEMELEHNIAETQKLEDLLVTARTMQRILVPIFVNDEKNGKIKVMPEEIKELNQNIVKLQLGIENNNTDVPKR